MKMLESIKRLAYKYIALPLWKIKHYMSTSIKNIYIYSIKRNPHHFTRLISLNKKQSKQLARKYYDLILFNSRYFWESVKLALEPKPGLGIYSCVCGEIYLASSSLIDHAKLFSRNHHACFCEAFEKAIINLTDKEMEERYWQSINAEKINTYEAIIKGKGVTSARSKFEHNYGVEMFCWIKVGNQNYYRKLKPNDYDLYVRRLKRNICNEMLESNNIDASKFKKWVIGAYNAIHKSIPFLDNARAQYENMSNIKESESYSKRQKMIPVILDAYKNYYEIQFFYDFMCNLFNLRKGIPATEMPFKGVLNDQGKQIKTKGEMINHVIKMAPNNTLAKYLCSIYDKDIRNAAGHNTYSFDNNSNEISFYNDSGKLITKVGFTMLKQKAEMVLMFTITCFVLLDYFYWKNYKRRIYIPSVGVQSFCLLRKKHSNPTICFNQIWCHFLADEDLKGFQHLAIIQAYDDEKRKSYIFHLRDYEMIPGALIIPDNELVKKDIMIINKMKNIPYMIVVVAPQLPIFIPLSWGWSYDNEIKYAHIGFHSGNLEYYGMK